MRDKLCLAAEFTLFDDESVKEKLTVMDKWDAVCDDSRNDLPDMTGDIDKYLVMGKRYRMTIVVEELEGRCDTNS